MQSTRRALWPRITEVPQMTDIEHELRATMHAAVDGEQAPGDMVHLVMRRHRRYVGRVAAAAAIGVLVAVVAPVVVAARSQGPVPPRGQPTASATAPPSAVASATPSAARSEPSWMLGLPMPPTEHLRLLLTGRAPAWYSVATGQTAPISGLPPSKFAYTLLRMAGGWATEPSPKGRACSPD